METSAPSPSSWIWYTWFPGVGSTDGLEMSSAGNDSRGTRRTRRSTAVRPWGSSPSTPGNGYVGVEQTDSTFLLVAGPGITGCETATNDPSSGADKTDGTDGTLRPVLFTDNMRYCETTLADCDDVTIVGRLETVHRQDGAGSRLSDTRGAGCSSSTIGSSGSSASSTGTSVPW